MSPTLRVLPGGAGDAQEPLHLLYERYGAMVRARCLYLLKDRFEADDAMHDVFARALRHRQSFRGEAAPSTWLIGIATHHCLNLLRARKARWREELVQLERVRPADEGGAAALEGRDLVRALLGRFDTETQAAAVHYYVDEMTLEEVAAAIGRSVPTVRKRLAGFAAVARTELEAMGVERGAGRRPEEPMKETGRP